MSNIITIMIISILLSGCAPLPGGKFLPEITHETALQDIPDLEIHEVALPIAAAKCHWEMFKQNPIFTTIFFGGGIWACADITPDGKGGVRRCEVWAPSFLLDHELEHCKGWADRWY